MSGDILLEASDENTPPDRLDAIYLQNRNRPNTQKIIRALAANPNSSLGLLKQLFIYELGMANVVLENPVASFLLLENFNVFKEWVILGQIQNKIFAYKLPSPELQKIALSTEHKEVWLELVKLKCTQPEIIDSIANRINWFKKIPSRGDYRDIETMIQQEIAKNVNTSTQTLIKILQKSDDEVTRDLAYTNITKYTNKKLEIDEYFTTNPPEHAGWLLSIMSKLESLIEFATNNKKCVCDYKGNIKIPLNHYDIYNMTSINMIYITLNKRICIEYCQETKVIYKCFLSPEEKASIESSFLEG